MPKADLGLRYHRAFDPKIPFYDRTPHNRRIRACLVSFLDSVGTHLICPRAACRREGGCADRDPAGLPFCWTHHRGTLRFLLHVAGRRLGVDGAAPRPPVPDDEVRPPEPFSGTPLLARLAARGVPIERLARSVEDGPELWGHEQVPELQAAFERLTKAP